MDTQQIIQVGNSLAVTIPKQIAQKFGWKKGQQIYIGKDEANKILRVGEKPLPKDGLTEEYFLWKKEFIKKNKPLLESLAHFHGKTDEVPNT